MTSLTNKTRMKGECKESKTESYEEPYETDADRYRKRQNHPTKKSHQKRGRERDGCDAIYAICAVLYCKARGVGKLTVFGSKAVFVRT